MTYQCLVCGDPTERGTLMLVNGRWIAVPLCPEHRDELARQPKSVPVYDARTIN